MKPNEYRHTIKNTIPLSSSFEMAKAHLAWIERDGLDMVAPPIQYVRYFPRPRTAGAMHISAQPAAIEDIETFLTKDVFTEMSAVFRGENVDFFKRACIEMGIGGFPIAAWAMFLGMKVEPLAKPNIRNMTGLYNYGAQLKLLIGK